MSQGRLLAAAHWLHPSYPWGWVLRTRRREDQRRGHGKGVPEETARGLQLEVKQGVMADRGCHLDTPEKRDSQLRDASISVISRHVSGALS